MSSVTATRCEISEEEQALMIARIETYRAEQAAYQQQLPEIRAAGIEALRRLMTIAQCDSGQCRRVAAFLLGLYNGERFPFDLANFRILDSVIFNDCLTVLRMDYTPEWEVHRYFENGGKLFERLARDWDIRDRQANG
jgi:hypothetical protein